MQVDLIEDRRQGLDHPKLMTRTTGGNPALTQYFFWLVNFLVPLGDEAKPFPASAALDSLAQGRGLGSGTTVLFRVHDVAYFLAAIQTLPPGGLLCQGSPEETISGASQHRHWADMQAFPMLHLTRSLVPRLASSKSCTHSTGVS